MGTIQYFLAFMAKFGMTLIVLWFIPGFLYGVTFGEILTTSIILSALSFAGDVFILPRVGNVIATIGDFILAMAGIMIIGANLFITPIPLETVAFISASFLTGGEIFFHMYMRAEFYNKNKEQGDVLAHQLQTEHAEEIDPDIEKDKKE